VAKAIGAKSIAVTRSGVFACAFRERLGAEAVFT